MSTLKCRCSHGLNVTLLVHCKKQLQWNLCKHFLMGFCIVFPISLILPRQFTQNKMPFSKYNCFLSPNTRRMGIVSSGDQSPLTTQEEGLEQVKLSELTHNTHPAFTLYQERCPVRYRCFPIKEQN